VIEQQYYTRERKGVFSSSPGFDTVARSGGLSDHFIKNVLHPFCIYETPAELIGKSDISKDSYPDCITCYTADTDCKELIIGRSCFAGPDYTGMRDTYFVHNLVVADEKEKKSCLGDLEKIFSIDLFRGSYNPEEGQELKQLSTLTLSDVDGLLSFKEALAQANISEEIFKSMVIASIKSVVNKKRVYISLNAEAKDFALIAKSLMKYIIAALPHGVRNSFGFMTFAPQPKNRKNINLMFIEKGGIRHNDSEVTREYVFDLTKGKYLNIELKEKSGYVDKAVQYITNGDKVKLKDMHNKIERPYSLLSSEEKASVELFDALLDIVYSSVESCGISEEDCSKLISLTYKLACKDPMQAFSPFKIKFENILKFLVDRQLSDKEISALFLIYEDEACYKPTRDKIKNIFMTKLMDKDYSDDVKIQILSSFCENEQIFRDIAEALKEENNDIIYKFAAREIKETKTINDLDKALLCLRDRNSLDYNNIEVQRATEQVLEKIIKNSRNKFEARKSLKKLLDDHGAEFAISIINREAFRNFNIINITKADLKLISKSEIIQFYGDENLRGSIKEELIILALLVDVEDIDGSNEPGGQRLSYYHNKILSEMEDIIKINRELLPRAQGAIKSIYSQEEQSEYLKLRYGFYKEKENTRGMYNNVQWRFNTDHMTGYMDSLLKNKKKYINYLNDLYDNWFKIHDSLDVFERKDYFETLLTDMIDKDKLSDDLVKEFNFEIQQIVKEIKDERKFSRKLVRGIKKNIFLIAIIILSITTVGGIVFLLRILKVI